jgi:hypothetical protein
VSAIAPDRCVAWHVGKCRDLAQVGIRTACHGLTFRDSRFDPLD